MDDRPSSAPAAAEPMVLLDAVTRFRGPFRPLSNFYLHRIDLDGESYPTVEHCFQAAKTTDPVEHARIRDAPGPSDAKRLGRDVVLRPDWAEQRVRVMRRALAAKFTLTSAPGRVLLETGHVMLIEGNDWGARFWGVSDGRGTNLLGVLLTERRGVLHQQRSGPTSS